MRFPGFRDQGDTALIPDSVVITMISSSIKCQTEMRSIFKTNNLLVKKHTFEPGMSMNLQHRYANVALSQCMEATYALNSTPTEDSFSNYFSKTNENLHPFPQSFLFTLYRRKKTTTTFPGSIGEDPGNEVDKTI